MYPPTVHDESETLVAYVDQQLDALRAAPYGLTEAQARATPCRSVLSVAGILKHVVHVMRGAIEVLAAPEPPPLDPSAYAEYLAQFSLTDDESVEDVLTAFDELRPRYLAALAAADPGAERLAPAAPWYGIHEALPIHARYYLGHQVEELARHAGHADIIREQVDGMAVPALVMSMAGMPANQFFEPYVPAEGTIGA
ncbi:DUF664 domain-containing protein [Phycicoccus sp. CSK15P-2]|uniref:DinB family protein n=1 Tax=Phycicoccus sp. CSK15P-2 TaxID=2807627 RepID=UPI00194DE89D|nr:DinB family protein [Phycicoccus sp. CSK15P-2]MBM6404680.1 DUF664 domain-containing protein [Phycicoccus sp. CSK15P-2]